MTAGGSGAVMVIGASSGLGRGIAAEFASRGRTVIVAGRDLARSSAVAAELDGDVSGLEVDLCRPELIAGQLAGVERIDHLVLTPVHRDPNTVRDFDVASATLCATMKLVGYTAVVNALLPALHDGSSILLFGGISKDRPYPGSTMVTGANGAVSALVTTMAVELAPVRVNGLHPGVVSDTPAWATSEAFLADVGRRTPINRPVTTAEVVHAAVFLLENGAANAVNLPLDGGFAAA
ncbi:MAG: hypothetical protein QOH72_1408 [Solirubrobacteraceae bacterium]|nr:hypothetical protein [Solirubrobacteraceae bacterium]